MSLKYAVLSKLLDKPRTGYDISQAFQSSVGELWGASHQQIYKELGRLKTEGFVSLKKIPQRGKPDKKIYKIRDKGLKSLKDWICQPHDFSVNKDKFLLKVFVGHLVPKKELLAEVNRNRLHHQEKLKVYKYIESKHFSSTKKMPYKYQLQYLTLKNGIQYERQWLRWCKELTSYISEDG